MMNEQKIVDELDFVCDCSEADEVCETLRAVLGEIEAGQSVMEQQFLRPGVQASPTNNTEDYLYERVCKRAGITKGAYYILLDALEFHEPPLVEHGFSARFPWLTTDGKRLLKTLIAAASLDH